MHVVFQEPDSSTLLKSFELDPSLDREVIVIRDDYSVGPLLHINTPEGWQRRKQWYQDVYQFNDDAASSPDMMADALSLKKIKDALQSSEEAFVWIWVAPNAQDVCGYYRLVSELSDFAGQVFVLHLNNLPFLSEKGAVFYPDNLFEIPPKEFLKAKKLARAVTAAEFETDPDEWGKICNSEKTVRTWEGAKKLAVHGEDFFDRDLTGFMSDNWQRGSKIVSQFLSKSKRSPSAFYLHWRLRCLVDAGQVEAQGDLKNLKEFEIRKKSNATAQISVE